MIPNLEEPCLKPLADHTAGSPTDEQIEWTNLTRREIVARLKEHGVTVSVRGVFQLLHKHDDRRRKAQKRAATGTVEHRNEQFLRLAERKTEYLASPNPVSSMDTKKKR